MNPSDSKRTPDHFDAYRTTNESPAVAPRDPNRRSPVRVLPTSVRAQNASHPNIDALIASDLQPLMAQKLNIGSPSNGNSNDNDATAAPTENQNNPNVETETIDWEKECNYMDGVFDEQSKEQLKGLPAYHKPKYFKKEINPYPHQRLGIRWLIQQERNPKDNPFVKSREMKDGSIGYYDSLQNHRKIDKPYGPAKGSILADEMGLGKTIQTLGLILSTLPSTQAFYHPGQAIATLIVCPKTVIPVWQEQINRFVNQGSIRMEVYSDERKRRSKIIPRVQNNEIDILIVSYETLACEFGDPWVDKRGNHIPDISDARFYRIVCDECQQIRNNKSKAFKAVMGVAAVSEHRLALTGSPFVNKPEDIHSLLCFVGLQPLDDPATFDQYITEPIKQRKRVGLTKLRAALAYTTLRRTKEGIRQSKDASDKFKIVEKTIHTMSIEFPEGPHKNIHNALYATTQAIIMSSCAETEDGMDVNTGRGLFEMVLRIRQSCASPELVPPERIERALAAFAQIADDDGNVKQLTTQERLSLLEKLQVGSEEDSTAEDSNGCTEKASFDTSPKILALLQAAEKISKDEKGVIFSQWTSFLDLIGSALVHAGHKVCRIDGSMDLESRRLAMHTFATDDEVRFILCSLKAAGTGIDLARANHVFLMDPWWNEAVESQAIDRCHRITSTKPVFVHKLVMKGTIEERMIKIQKAKAMLGKASMQKISKEEEKQAKMTAMKDLFQIESNIVNEKWFY